SLMSIRGAARQPAGNVNRIERRGCAKLIAFAASAAGPASWFGLARIDRKVAEPASWFANRIAATATRTAPAVAAGRPSDPTPDRALAAQGPWQSSAWVLASA